MARGSRTGGRAVVASVLGLLLAAPVAAAALTPPTHLTVVFAPRNGAVLRAYAQAVSDPTSWAYRHYLTPGQFASRFGASPAAIARVRRQLQAHGLTLGTLSANHLSIRAALATGTSRRPLAVLSRLAPSSFTGVQAIEGLRPTPGPHPLVVRSHLRRATFSIRPHVVTGGPQPCAAARDAARSSGAFTADQIASAYGLSDIFHRHDLGAGITIALYELEPVAASDLAAFQSCYRTDARIDYVRVDGGAGSGAGSGEAAVDIENVLGYAPGAHLLIYQGPNSTSGSPGSGPYDVFSSIINQDRAQVVSVSWGECEAALGASSAQAENTLFEQAAVQGQTVVAAAGDTGAQDCEGTSPTPSPQPSVDDPAGQPFVTGVGGTTLDALGPRPFERVWNNGGTPSAVLSAGAGGGGISSFWGMPTAQMTVASSLGVRNGAPNGAVCGQPGSWCREVPDVSVNTDPATGYEIYWNGAGSDPISPRGWQAFGGTSAGSPVWASLIALADAWPGCVGASIGMALPALYRAAASDYAGAFNDIRSGHNDFTGTNSGQFAAGPGYDLASGLGSPNASVLIPKLCANALRLNPIGAQRTARRAAISPLGIGAHDVPGAGVYLSVRGLPPGLHFVSARKRITGRPRRSGVYHVTVAAHDQTGAHAREIFTWTIGAPTRLVGVSVTGLAARRPNLVFTVAAGRLSPALSRLSFAVPSELQLRSTRSIRITSARPRARFTAHLKGGQLTLNLHRPEFRVQVRLGSGALSTGRGGGPLAGRLTVTAAGTDGSSSTIRARIQRR